MNERIIKAIVIKSTEYHDYDKLLKLLTFEEGVITAVIKGVRKHKAKLKFGAMPFAYCEYSLVERGGFLTVTNCSLIEDFFEMTSCFDKFTSGSIMLEVADYAMNRLVVPEIFLLMLKCLKTLAYESSTPIIVATFFVVKTLLLCGYGIEYPISNDIKSYREVLGYLKKIKCEGLVGLDFLEPIKTLALKNIISSAEENFMCEIKSKKLFLL